MIVIFRVMLKKHGGRLTRSWRKRGIKESDVNLTTQGVLNLRSCESYKWGKQVQWKDTCLHTPAH